MSAQMLIGLMLVHLTIGSIFVLFVYRHFYFKAKQQENRYFLYKVRDDLILLVARGQLSKDEFLFTEIYPRVNMLINEINTFTFKDIIAALSLQEQLLKTSDFSERLIEEMSRKPLPVRRVFVQLYDSICFIIYRNSLTFRILCRLFKTFKTLKRLIQRSDIRFNSLEHQQKAFQYYDFCHSVQT